MKVIEINDSHEDERRHLQAYPLDFGIKEFKTYAIHQDGIELGNHSHNHDEAFFLAHGECSLVTWNQKDGKQKYGLKAPILFTIAPDEEHLFTMRKDSVLFGMTSVPFDPKNNVEAENLK